MRTASRCVPDDRTGSAMGIAEVTDKIGVKERVDFLALELCNMGGIEIAYQWRPGNGGFEADVLLAIPNAGPAAGLGSGIRPHPFTRPCLERRAGPRSGQDDGSGLWQTRDRRRPSRQAGLRKVGRAGIERVGGVLRLAKGGRGQKGRGRARRGPGEVRIQGRPPGASQRRLRRSAHQLFQ